MTVGKKDEQETLLSELSNVLSERREAAVAARIDLRDAVCAYVAVEQARGMPLATVIQTVKEILQAAESEAGTATDELAVQLIDWCVEFHRSKATPNTTIIS